MSIPRASADRTVAAALPPIEAVDALTPEALVDLLTQLGGLTERARARLAMFGAQRTDAVSTDGDRLLTAEEAAAKLGTTTDWIYRHHRKLPFTVQLSSQQLRFSARGIERWIALRQGSRRG